MYQNRCLLLVEIELKSVRCEFGDSISATRRGSGPYFRGPQICSAMNGTGWIVMGESAITVLAFYTLSALFFPKWLSPLLSAYRLP